VKQSLDSEFETRQHISMAVRHVVEIGSYRTDGVVFGSHEAAAECEAQKTIVFYAVTTTAFQDFITFQMMNAQKELFPANHLQFYPIFGS
jgi:hypothetical protein